MAIKARKKRKEYQFPERMGVKDVSEYYAENVGCTEKEAREQVENVVNCLCNCLCAGSTVSFVGKFTLSVNERPAREARNPRTGEKMKVPAQRVVKFKVGASLKNALNGD